MVERYTIPVVALKSELEARVRYVLKSIIEFYSDLEIRMMSVRGKKVVGENIKFSESVKEGKHMDRKRGSIKKQILLQTTKFLS